MIYTDQPDCFDATVLVAVSSKRDGSMLNRDKGVHHPDIIRNRRHFCEHNKALYEDTVYQKICYGSSETYELLKEVTHNDTVQYHAEVHADALFTTEVGVGLFLPVADCVATIVYDPERRFLALLHMGRHSTLTSLVKKTIGCFEKHGSNMDDLIVWMSPSAKRDTYRLDWFDHEHDEDWQEFLTKGNGYFLDLPGYNRQRFVECGVNSERIYISPVDTTKDSNYFSHRAEDTTDRIAVLAMMR